MFNVSKGGQIVLTSSWTSLDMGTLLSGGEVDLTDDEVNTLKECAVSAKPFFITFKNTPTTWTTAFVDFYNIVVDDNENITRLDMCFHYYIDQTQASALPVWVNVNTKKMKMHI